LFDKWGWSFVGCECTCRLSSKKGSGGKAHHAQVRMFFFFKKNALQGVFPGQTYSVKLAMRPSAARNEVNFCAEMLGTLPLPWDVLVLEAPVAVPDVGEPPLGAVLEGAAPLAAARKAS